jgi:hypothetical protein
MIGLNRRSMGLLLRASTTSFCPLYVIVVLHSACTPYIAESHRIQCSTCLNFLRCVPHYCKGAGPKDICLILRVTRMKGSRRPASLNICRDRPASGSPESWLFTHWGSEQREACWFLGPRRIEKATSSPPPNYQLVSVSVTCFEQRRREQQRQKKVEGSVTSIPHWYQKRSVVVSVVMYV